MMYFRAQVIWNRKTQRHNDFDVRCDCLPKLFISTLEKHWNQVKHLHQTQNLK